MQDVDPDKTRVIRQKPGADPAPPAVADADDSERDITQMMQPSERARAAAEVLQSSRLQQPAGAAPGDYQWSGEVDFDVTAETVAVPAPRRAWPHIAGWVVGLALIAASAWWLMR